MKLWITRPMTAAVEARAREEFDVDIRPDTGVLSRAEMQRALRDYDVVMPTLGDRFDAEIFAAVPAPRCRLLANFGVGYNHIDVEAARAAGVAVTNTPGAVTDATADIAMTLLLMSARRAGEGERLVRDGSWEGWHPTQMLGQHVTGKTVGIVGLGRIGAAIGQRCHFGFGMKVLYTARSDKDPGFPVSRCANLSEMAAQVDFLVVAVPGGADTRHMVDEAVLAAMQPHAHLINIARGEIVKEAALITALQEQRIAGAGLDVYEFEPEVPEVLRALDRVTLLPHLGTATEEVRSNMGHMVLDNVAAFIAGQKLPNPV
ncbi:2-hydroxyacid dehydrogenase [Phaeobacter gallaeciensis]|uniref:2-hydroxyacid dehydrogenase n=1 Tax=Phaeobacter gallaeciensis TaxID=60890 RepID=A0A1B0ZVI4_9RHOB|nr:MULTISPECIES: D-glycerate dehydrogenase [Phaeobacter]MDF1771598.1 D-glycerate dehydrogenase [Pseudophaeobacter sp. bin_em_oilr2.035]MEE2633480.1 D-glycerate dehydrogenase [Pseudomonadota bacterium]ANP38223.1 2-hydroxyacid dehydrogenase [Phaeobacter gallaeciensis]MDE4063587.1 D-glycerate dehydrogenase [Phaeobacter gallaeciensis]MDE4126597.1 D-glycerate dehydrogenase [Phaeobacter gallaeciensis]